MKKGGLGRGLGSLIPKKTEKEFLPKNSLALEGSGEEKILQIPVSNILANPQQPRKNFSQESLNELVDSIKEHGIFQPLIGTKTENGYQLIAGERRLRAAKICGLKTVPMIIREAKKQNQLELSLIENIQRQNLNPIEEAVAFRRLMDEFNITQEKLAKRLGKSRPVITNTVRLLTLPEKIQKALIDGKINYSAARIIVGLPENKRMPFFENIIKNQFTVRNAEDEAKKVTVKRHLRSIKDPNLLEKEEQLQSALNTKVRIKKTKVGGQIIIDYFSNEELSELVKKIKKD